MCVFSCKICARDLCLAASGHCNGRVMLCNSSLKIAFFYFQFALMPGNTVLFLSYTKIKLNQLLFLDTH